MFSCNTIIVKAGMTALLALTAASAFADAPSYVRVRSINYAGTGCPAGSVAENISADRQAFTVLFDNYQASTGPGVPFTEKRKNCQLVVALDFPAGWSFTLFQVQTRGYVSLDPGVTALQQTSYYFQGQTQNATMRSLMQGPLDQDYEADDVLGVSAFVWSPCGASRALNLNTQVRTDSSMNPGGQGLITVDSIDGQFALIYGMQWRQCI